MDKIIELGIVEIMVSPSTERLTAINFVGSFYEDPGEPIDPFITKLTGITTEMVEGHSLPDDTILSVLERSDSVLVAHNASFDSRFVEKRYPSLKSRRWACTIADVDWNAKDFSSSKLEYLLTCCGYFYDAHRAQNDCLAVAWLLSYVDVLKELIRSEASLTYKISAVGSPFAAKDELKVSVR
ncbi:hypothetical protein MLC70_17770 [Marinobacter goseongensis]|nr:hypothetical protein [Marinobacter goseongensis]